MNSKQIIRALNALFQLDDEDRGLVLKLWNLSESDREAFVQALQVQPQGKVTAKAGKKDADTKKRNLEHCGVCDYTRRAAHHKDTSHKDYHEFHSRTERPPKSQRASSIQQQIQGRTRTTASSGDDDDTIRPACVFKNGDYNCGLGVDSPVHRPDGGYAGYHPFVSPSPARNAGGRSSSKNGSPDTSAASSETETDAAGVAVSAGG